MYVCERTQTNISLGDYAFECSYGICISYLHVCDGKKDCSGDISADEVGCECNITLKYTSQCKLIDIQNNIECSDFYFKTWTGICKLYDFTLVSDNNLQILTKSIANKRKLHEQQSIDQKMGNFHAVQAIF